MKQFLEKIINKTKSGKWHDDGSDVICDVCGRTLDSRYVERKGVVVRVPFTCPNCHSHMTDVVRSDTSSY
jgi:Zn finger protein HypA/HybF involved in hydrogenase expression